MSTPPRPWYPTTLGYWIISLVILICVILVILALGGVGFSTPGWLVYALIAALGFGVYLR